ncbi:MAG: GNAT family N-acetyltransferase [Kofleriaceae bacterium]
MKTVDLSELGPAQVDQLAALTLEAAREHSPTWLPDLERAREVIAEAQGKFARVLLDDTDAPVAWVAASHAWGRIWELHPMIVAVAHQRRGHGRRLVQEVEAAATRAGALTLCLSTSDMTEATSLSGVDLFDDPLRRAAELQAKPHAVQFWQRIGFQVVGVTPDAEGPGQPSINLAKRLSG